MYEIICAGPHSGFLPIPRKEEALYIIFKDEVPVGRVYPVDPEGLYFFEWAGWIKRHLITKHSQVENNRFFIDVNLYFNVSFHAMQFLRKGQLLAFFEMCEAMKFLVESDQKFSDKAFEKYKHAFLSWSYELANLQHFESENEFYSFRSVFSQKEKLSLIRFLTAYELTFV